MPETQNTDNPEREQRILDAAASLFVHYGYDKTTVSDIAREAGVSKGAIYLHFASKDELFEALLMREMMTYANTWLNRLEADPKGGTMGGMYKNMLYALNSSPFMAMMFKQDRRVFGTYLRKPGNFFQRYQDAQDQSSRFLFVKMMQDAGAMRQDIDPKVVAHIMNMLAFGLVGLDDLVPEKDIPPMEDVIEGIAEIMDRALTPEEARNSDIGKQIIRQIANAGLEQYDQMREEDKEQKQ
jgi:TetR/AcrR family acrAB operon transcriptional repressor